MYHNIYYIILYIILYIISYHLYYIYIILYLSYVVFYIFMYPTDKILWSDLIKNDGHKNISNCSTSALGHEAWFWDSLGLIVWTIPRTTRQYMYIISYHIILYYILSYHIMLYYIMLFIILYYFIYYFTDSAYKLLQTNFLSI